MRRSKADGSFRAESGRQGQDIRSVVALQIVLPTAQSKCDVGLR